MPDNFFLTDPLYWQTVKEDFASGAATHRAVAAAKAELGIFAGSAQLAYCVFTRGLTAKAIGAHGIGNYLGSIGELSNVVYGGNRNWNITKSSYEMASKSVLGEANYGATAFYATDFLFGLSMMLKSVRVDDVVQLGKGVSVTLERRRWVPSELLQPPSIILNDLFSEYQDLLQTYSSSTSK